ncbi:hypothetical protein [Brachyspira aalborgi]|jgi:hypothetical protein|uniref:Uncharacterized protein n=1 Tax=Brachyspira aalborgi TaxID=29522 RepID=A0ABY3K7J0_9SPIR|nr:hypothetical protein [Brachyspira aalborgi]TXJ31195.1 hypothetical protein EPJ71_10700 [Brachyspira aalborgi]TXJ40085.1 hypothetical protein EPJ65_12640 [Brachyspira aalborgi]DAZ18890.1 MAG TPA: hypothetical protein [Caudoviricetes sp.]
MTLKEFKKELEKYEEHWALYCFENNIKNIFFLEDDKDEEDGAILKKAVVLEYNHFYKEKTINIKEFLEITKDKSDNYDVLGYNDLLDNLCKPNVLKVICDTNLDFTGDKIR